MPISSKTLFRITGLPLDVFEIELKREGWLYETEDLLDVLMIEENLRRRHPRQLPEVDTGEGFDDTWTEEDYIAFYEGLKRRE